MASLDEGKQRGEHDIRKKIKKLFMFVQCWKILEVTKTIQEGSSKLEEFKKLRAQWDQMCKLYFKQKLKIKGLFQFRNFDINSEIFYEFDSFFFFGEQK